MNYEVLKRENIYWLMWWRNILKNIQGKHIDQRTYLSGIVDKKKKKWTAMLKIWVRVTTDHYKTSKVRDEYISFISYGGLHFEENWKSAEMYL